MARPEDWFECLPWSTPLYPFPMPNRGPGVYPWSFQGGYGSPEGRRGEIGQIVKSSATLGKKLNRREPAEAFARAIVEEHFNFIQTLPGNRPEIAAFWEEKAQQTIGIFVGTTFPWRRRMRKVNDCVELVRKFPMIGKL